MIWRLRKATAQAVGWPELVKPCMRRWSDSSWRNAWWISFEIMAPDSGT
jgi:hypothetical protein